MKKYILIMMILIISGCKIYKNQVIQDVDAHNETRRVKQFRFGLNTPFLENYQEIVKYAQPDSLTHKIAQRNVDAVTSIRKDLMEELKEYNFKPLTPQEAHKELIRIQQDRLIFVYDFENHYKKIVNNLKKKQHLSENEKKDLKKAEDHLEKYKTMIQKLKDEISQLESAKF